MSFHAMAGAGALALAVFLSSGPGPAPARAAETASERPRLECSGELDVVTHYLWRGISLSCGPVVNPSITLARGGSSLSIWANLDRDPQAPVVLNEVDLTLDWCTEWLGLEITSSLQYFAYPTTDAPNTSEVQVEIGRGLRGPFSAFARQSVEILEVRGAAWSAAGIAFDLPGWKHFAVDASIEYGRGWRTFASVYADPSLAAVNLASLRVGAVASLPGSAFTLRPRLEWHGVGGAHARAALSGSPAWVAGLALGAAF